MGHPSERELRAIVVMGMVLGYPECCTDEHRVRISSGSIYPSALARQAMATAPKTCRYHWIPCKDCAERLINGSATFKSLLTWDRPLTDLAANLQHAAVQRRAQSVLSNADYELFQDWAARAGEPVRAKVERVAARLCQSNLAVQRKPAAMRPRARGLKR
eukprot:6471872-Amphidinium_carterae.1